MRDHERQLIMSWAGIFASSFVHMNKDDSSFVPKALLSLEQVESLIRYAYDMGRTDAIA